MNRGDRREPIFPDDADRARFLATLGEACGRTGWATLRSFQTEDRRLQMGRAVGGGDVAKGGLAGKGIGSAQERGPDEGGHGGALATGDNDELELDGETAGEGGTGARPPALRESFRSDEPAIGSS